VKISGGVIEMYISIIETLPWTEPPKYIWWPCVAAEHGGLIKRERKFMGKTQGLPY